ncbi:hypothetical protein [Umezawaea sp. Da 62-37]|uniref:hypothetical protein n=1 Tax=Umezawaea sp. Da 62-37 TaxID=3075927 RepID=UPI0028F745A8|nr:hypothetical protein [Umezawaea sp. Da 62-37]WNV88823.1 hypothetical protein RM788_11135 [Umezawaea sp. Da 62-37]
MSDPKVPEGTTPEPASTPPRVEQPTTPQATPQPAQPVQATQPIATPEPQPVQPAAQPVAEQPAQPTVNAAEAPAAGPAPQPATAGPPARFRRVAAHRGAQLVAVGVLGLIIGGGVVALLDHDGYGRGGPGRAGMSRMDHRGPGPGPDRGPRGWENHGRFER